MQASLRSEMQTLLAGDGFVIGDAADGGIASFELKNADGDITEEVHIHAGFVHAFWNEYRGWTNTRELVVRRLSPVIDHVRHGRLSGVGLGMACKDVFISDTSVDYDILEVFQPANRFLPPFAYEENEPVWKVSSSWLVPPQHDNDHLTYNTLSIEAEIGDVDHPDEQSSGSESEEDDDAPHTTEILHRQSLYLNAGNPIVDPAVEWSDEAVRVNLDRLHKQNKSLMLNLLNNEMSDRIGLKE